MAFAQEKIVVLIVLSIFYGISIPLTIHWLMAYKAVANTRHKCITSRHFNTTWGYLICCICASNLGHPSSILLHIYILYCNLNAPPPLVMLCYLLSDLSTFTVFYMCLVRAYMMMWDKKYNLARKEQFWTKKIVNDELESYEINEIEDDDENNSLSPFIKYKRNLGNVKYVSVFMLCILVPITLFFILSPFIFIHTHNRYPHTLSCIFRFVSTIPVVFTLVFIYFKIPKYNEAIGLRVEVKAIVQIICGTFVSCNVLISLTLYCLTNVIHLRYILPINGTIHSVSAFLLFYTSTGLILPRLRKIISDDSLPVPITGTATSAIPTKRRPFVLSHKLQFLVLSWSNHKTNKPNLSSLSIPPFIGDRDAAISAEKKLKRTLTIWRRRKDMAKSSPHIHNHTDTTVRKGTDTLSAVSPPYHSAINNNEIITMPTDINDDFSFIDGAVTSSFTANNMNVMHLLQHTSNSELRFNRLKDQNSEPCQADRPFEIVNCNGTEIEEIEEFDDDREDEVAVNEDHNITDHEEEEDEEEDIEIEIDEITRGKGYSYSKHASITIGLQSISPAFITPQISKTSDSKPHSRRTSSKFNPSELVNINTTTATNTNTTTVTFSGNANKIVLPSTNNSNRSSKQSQDTPIGGHRDHSNRSTPIGSIYNKARRHSLSVKDAYAGIKQIFGGHRNSMKSSSRSNCDDPEEKIYFEIRLEDPLNVVLSDQDGLARFADHLCSEFSIENLLFIVEALQYRYCIPLSLFDDHKPNLMESELEDNNTNNQNAEKMNNTESVELLMHIIHQNKKLPISKLLKQHQSCCCFIANPNHFKTHKTQDSPPTQSASHDREAVDFMSSSIENDTYTSHMTPIRRKSGSDEKEEQCCKECTVEKFKYIIEKYVETTSINLPSATQRKLMNIWNELKIKDPDKRFLNKIKKIKNKKRKQIVDKTRMKAQIHRTFHHKKKKNKKKKKTKQKAKQHDTEKRERNESKSKSIVQKLRRHKEIKKHITNDEEQVCCQMEEEEKEKEDENHHTTEDKTTPLPPHRQQTLSNTLQSEDERIRTTEQIPSHSVSPRDRDMVEMHMTEIDVNVNHTCHTHPHADRIPVASYSNADTPSNIPHSQLQQHHTAEHTSHHDHSHNNSQLSMSHLTSTPITNNTITTPTDCEEEEDEEPLPQSPIRHKQITCPSPDSPRDTHEEAVTTTATTTTTTATTIITTTNSNSNTNTNTNSLHHNAEEEEEQKVEKEHLPHEEEEREEEEEEKKQTEEMKKEEEELENDIEESASSMIEPFVHDGFGNINFITVFDDAILEIMKLMKSDTWRRFKRSKQFVDWANDFKRS